MRTGNWWVRNALRVLCIGVSFGLVCGLLPPAPVRAASPLPDELGEEEVTVYIPAGVRVDGTFVDDVLRRTMNSLGMTKPPLAGEFPKANTETLTVQEDAYTEINELFYKRGWTDGLPIVPPTEARVEAMLRGTDLSPDHVVATVEPMAGQATVEKIAVNAVMAGCRPEYMPVLIAAVEAVTDPALDLKGMATTTSPDVPMLIINGPIVEQLDINAGVNALGRGWQANASIGRALHLIIQNVGGSWPGVTDMSSLGQPGDFTMVLAENEKANPWRPLHVELGYPRESNVVTVVGAEGTHTLIGSGLKPEEYLRLISDHLVGLGLPHRSIVVLIIAQDNAEMLAREGWTKTSIRRFIYENARMPFSEYKPRFIDTNRARLFGGVPPWVLVNPYPDRMIPVPYIDNLLILVAGGTGAKSMVIPCWFSTSKVISREIKLPAHWEELLPAETKD